MPEPPKDDIQFDEVPDLSLEDFVGDTAFQFVPPPGFVNPVLTRDDVSDVPPE